MRKMILLFAAPLLGLAPAQAQIIIDPIPLSDPEFEPKPTVAPPPPASVERSIEVKAMLDAAMKSGDDGAVGAIVKYAKAADQDRAVAFEKTASAWRKQRREAAERKIREASFVELVKGRAEVGAYYMTGNTEQLGLTGVLDLTREGLEWRHKLRLQADYQESLGVTIRERYLASYEPNWKVDDRLYVYGAAQFESDRFLGYDTRASLSAGAGYTAVKTAALKLDVELGPAYRHTAFTDDTIESQIAARGKLDLDWKLSPSITFSQDASAYLQAANSTIVGKTALRARLFGPLSAQMSYAVNYESSPPIGRRTTDTTSRASLLVDF